MTHFRPVGVRETDETKDADPPTAGPVSAPAFRRPARWVVVCAHVVVLCALPSGLWRLCLAATIPVGYSTAELHRLYDIPGWGMVYVIGLSVAQECLALLTLGLVRPWGETVPRWVPVIGGRHVPIRAAVIPAAVGAVVLTAITVSQLLVWDRVDHGGLSDTGRTVLGYCYLPLLLWGPLLGVVTVAYYRRRRTAEPATGGVRGSGARFTSRRDHH